MGQRNVACGGRPDIKYEYQQTYDEKNDVFYYITVKINAGVVIAKYRVALSLD